jgi:hypothetical protein
MESSSANFPRGIYFLMEITELPRRKQRGIFGRYVSFAASGGEYNPKRFKKALTPIILTYKLRVNIFLRICPGPIGHPS